MSQLPAPIVQEVEAIVAGARAMALDPDAETLQIKRDIAALPGVQRSSLVHYFQEWVIRFSRGKAWQPELDMLSRIQPLQLHCAPKYVTTIPTTEGHVAILRYWACPGETLVPVEDYRLPFSQAASERFRGEMQRVLALDLYHSAARGTVHWWIAQPSGTIVLDSWAALQPCRDHANQLAIIDLLLEERSMARYLAAQR